MQSENRLFDDAVKVMFKIVGSFFKLKKMLCETQQEKPHSFKEKKKDK